MIIDQEKELLASELRGSLLLFTQYFYPLLTGRDFIISHPAGRESHHITVCRALTQAARLEIPNHRLIINISPGSGKSTLLSAWVAWTFAQYPDSRFLYISYSKVLATKHTESIKRLMQLPHYQYLFDVKIRHDSKAKDYFQTEQGGVCASFGSGSAITGFDAGLPGEGRFTGSCIIDDAHKPDEVHSSTIRESVIENYRETIQQRIRGVNVPIIFIGQRLHEDDLAAYLLAAKDGYDWHKVIIKSIDDAGNAMYPEAQPLSMLKLKQEFDPYVFASQYQQNPIPAGGAVFKPEWFVLLDEEPTLLATFITADTAETSKSYNDATVFSFFGIYEIEQYGRKTGSFGLHWLDCLECRIEPKDLKDTFLDFWAECMRHPMPPKLIAIEKKSTGGTLLSLIDDIRAIQIRDIPRTRETGNKTKRFLESQPYVAQRRVSLTTGARHVKMCIDHMSKITANETHRWDDVCFTSNTKIATLRGKVNIQDIKLGDKIITPFGIGSVTACGSIGKRKVIQNIGLEGTPNHPIYYKDKFLPLQSLTDMIILNKLSLCELYKWKQRQLLYSINMNSDLLFRQDIINVSKANIEINFFIVLFGNFVQNKKYQKAIWFIIKTIINMIIVLKIWSVYRLNNIVQFILKARRWMRNIKENLWKQEESLNQNQNIKKSKNKLLQKLSIMGEKLNALFVIKNLKLLENNSAFVVQNVNEYVIMPGQENEINDNRYLNQYAFTVTTHLKQNMPCQRKTAEKLVHQNAQENGDMKEVFNLTVEPYGVYYANNILVSNCDTLADAIKFGLIDKTIITLTEQKADYTTLAKNLTMNHNEAERLRKIAFTR